MGGFAQPDFDTGVGRYVQFWGQEKTGKTTAALSFPQPIYLLSFDGNYRLAWKRAGAEGMVSLYAPKLNDGQVEAKQRLKSFRDDWVLACDEVGKGGGTVILDSETELWRLVQEVMVHIARDDKEREAVRAGKKYSQSRWDYGPANRFMEQVLTYPFHLGINCALVTRAKKVYVDGQETNQYGPHGYSETGFLVPSRIQCLYDREKGFRLKFDTCAEDMSMVGMSVGVSEGETAWDILEEQIG